MAKKRTQRRKPEQATQRSPVTLGTLFSTKDPRVYAQGIPRVRRPYKRIVGLDLASHTGVAFTDIVPGVPVNGVKLVLGQWDLSLGDYDSGPLRYIRLKQFLNIVEPDLVMFEDVKYVGRVPTDSKFNMSAIVARAVTGAQFVYGLKVITVTWCEECGIPAHGLPIQTIKRFATGKGVVSKEGMVRACNEQFGTDFDPITYGQTGVDNIADAAFCCALGVQLYSEGLGGADD